MKSVNWTFLGPFEESQQNKEQSLPVLPQPAATQRVQGPQGLVLASTYHKEDDHYRCTAREQEELVLHAVPGGVQGLHDARPAHGQAYRQVRAVRAQGHGS